MLIGLVTGRLGVFVVFGFTGIYLRWHRNVDESDTVEEEEVEDPILSSCIKKTVFGIRRYGFDVDDSIHPNEKDDLWLSVN
jgi:hypothetical protein